MLRKSAWLTAALSAVLALSTLPVEAAAGHRHARIPAYVMAAVADSGRPDADTKRDANRKPAETLAFAGIKPGDKVAELWPAAGYYTRMLSKIVGPSGHVYTLVPQPRPNAPQRPGRPDMMALAHTLAQNPEYPNVTVVPLQMSGGFGLPEPVDFFWTTLNYHDLHNLPHADMAAFNKEVFDALKPGGIYFIVDHAAAAGTGVSETRKLHRIDPAAARQEAEAAGFKYAGHSNALRNPHDSHMKIVFDPSIRGKTDQFMFKFRKPQ